MRNEKLKAPFPWFGGKSRVSDLVWSRFGDVPNYVEPFAGSLAVLLGRPHEPKTETVNDKDAFLSNFWRAIQFDPETTAKWADWPVSEPDLEARHQWLITTGAARLELVKSDPFFFDSQVAGWWVWGLCSWIGSGWCRVKERTPKKLPHLGNGQGINRQIPCLGNSGQGINRKLLYIGSEQGEKIALYFQALATRLRRVRVACGDWRRVLGESVTVQHGVTAVFLDPPYSGARASNLYAEDCFQVAQEVFQFAIQNGDNPKMRIALCGYEGEHEMPENWERVEWKAKGGYGSQGTKRGRENANRERIWFSPACIKPEAENLQLSSPLGGDRLPIAGA